VKAAKYSILGRRVALRFGTTTKRSGRIRFGRSAGRVGRARRAIAQTVGGAPQAERRHLELAARIDRGTAGHGDLAPRGFAAELHLPGRVLRIERESAAVAYPALTLVEHGVGGEAARRPADAQRPWPPHRTNVERTQRE